ncbi:MAG: multiheme c-type cytochrome [Pirellulaceae bacterium]
MSDKKIQVLGLSPRSLAVAAIVLAFATAYVAVDWRTGIPSDLKATFVGREECKECHIEQFQLFERSHHDLAMDVANEDTVLANFDGTVISHHGTESRVFRDGERFMVSTEGPDGAIHDYEVKYVFGYTPLQQYMVEIESPATDVGPQTDPDGNPVGRVQVLRVSWDVENQKWFHLDPPDVSDRLEPSDPLHWTGRTQCWNSNCAACHSTNLKKNFDTVSGTYATTFSEIDVSCEACHGPASLHVAQARSSSLFWDREKGSRCSIK